MICDRMTSEGDFETILMINEKQRQKILCKKRKSKR